MKTFLINLDKATDRLRIADAQLRELGIPYERISATNGKALSKEEKDRAVNKFRWWCAIGWPIRDGQIGCALSHYGIYKRMIRDQIPVACVFEDDVVISPRVNDVLSVIEKWISSTSPQVILLSNHVKKKRMELEDGNVHLVPSRKDQYTEGYVINLMAAGNLLRANLPMQRPCDQWGRWVRAGIINLYHAYPTTCSQNTVDFVSTTVPQGSPTVSELAPIPFALHKFKRCVGRALDRLLPL